MTGASEQVEFWNGRAGDAWVELQETLDGLFGPLEEWLAREVGERPGARVLDVGCGAGACCVAAARRLGPGGRCTGIDVSEPLIEAARRRVAREGVEVELVLGDAGSFGFEAGSFDLFISRFGVMFFADPAAAFANLRRAGAKGAELRFLVWRAREENPFMTVAERAVAALLPDLPPHLPDAPGQFGLANPDLARSALEEAGWRGIEIEPIEFECEMPEPDLLPYATTLGSVGRALQDVDAATRDRVVAALRPAFDPYVDGDAVRFTAACWAISGH